MSRLLRAVLLVLALWPIGAALAIDADELLPDRVQEARAERLGQEFRCLVCQNESIEESGADLARDLRRIVRQRIVAGDSDQAIRDFLVARYGDFVLLKPPFRLATIFLWLGPFILVALGAALAFVALRRRQGATLQTQPLDPAEQAELDRLVHAGGETRTS
ncbi:cytochrome c-type biogenesis protein CcmH [Arboricoccus pini]|uniref:Cytochrome c-type biogenesis protein n=1 Tax=Arboricoccus pini TaxID=1963835 RepID=A0A212PYA5_9PROT|nr:cytochrome c-type biogenesis protein [Arboricoccus pini]SNB51993.1 cytochrome c-type biogenesis protein CcmH [Arboricoccus pini]